MKIKVHWITLTVPILLVWMCTLSISASAHRGVKRVVKDGREVMLYKESHALVIGVSHYTGGWSDLPGVENDIEDVKGVLERHGFGITTVMDPDKDALDRAMGNFISRHGKGENNRLLIYFAGHGHTLTPKWGDEKRGYLVPRGAPNPYDDPVGFKARALSLQRIEEYAYDIDAKHAVFIFDACFSGSLLSMVRAVPEAINAKTASPIRQFFTSGDETEKVPDQSIFRAQFVAALEGEGNLNKDGYVTGTELGNFLQKKVTKYSRGSQHPQYGTIRHPKLNKGDFVFILPAPQHPGQIPGNGSPPAGQPVLTAGGPDPEYELWQEVKQSTDPGDFKFFLSEFPTGKYAATARYRIRKLAQNRTPPQSSPGTGTGHNDQPSNISPSTGSGPKRYTEPNTGMEFVWVQGGCYEMGNTFGEGESDEKPVHRVCVDGFWLGKTEVTQGQWRKVMGSNPSHFKKGDNYPVEQVSWNDCQTFIKKLNSRSGNNFRLPYEAEWEYAARSGGKDEKYAGGSNIDLVAWYRSNSGNQTQPVRGKTPNGLGVYDMSGNVWEWCLDWYGEDYYSNSPQDNPHGPSRGSDRVDRGGAWLGHPGSVRAANRGGNRPDFRYDGLGFRLALPSGH